MSAFSTPRYYPKTPRQSLAPRLAPLRKSSSAKWKGREDIIQLSDGREMWNPHSAGGGRERQYRTFLLWLRQYDPRRRERLCCNCRGPLELGDATFEHEFLRGKDRDDRLYDSSGRPINGASHAFCNRKRGSQRLPIWHGTLDVRNVRLTTDQYHYLRGAICFCSRKKEKLSSCCASCRDSLPGQMRRDLFSLDEINLFADALANTMQYLQATREGVHME